MSDIKQKFCPKQSTGCLGLHVACHILGLEKFMPSISLFFSLNFRIMLHSGTEMKHLMLATSRVAAEGPTNQPHICQAIFLFSSLDGNR